MKFDLEKLSDEELIAVWKQGDSLAFDVLHKRYKKVITALVRGCFLLDGDNDDLIQEASIALFNAASKYNGKASFIAFAKKCIQNRINSAITSSNRKKNLPLYKYISLSGSVDDDIDKSAIVISKEFGPEETFINEEDCVNLTNKIKQNLSELEYKIFVLFIEGHSITNISEKLSINSKIIDNAIQRAKKKVKLLIDGN